MLLRGVPGIHKPSLSQSTCHGPLRSVGFNLWMVAASLPDRTTGGDGGDGAGAGDGAGEGGGGGESGDGGDDDSTTPSSSSPNYALPLLMF